jgi:E3 ubiquitin-protein ligase TRIP12
MTYSHFQAHPLACAASLAVQRVVVSDNLLQNCRIQGKYLESLLKERLQGPNALAAPFTFDIRGGGGFWGIEFDFSCPPPEAPKVKGEGFGIVVQARCLEKVRIPFPVMPRRSSDLLLPGINYNWHGWGGKY